MQPATKTNVGATGLCSAAALRATAAYIRVIGAAVGTIMATIITAHIVSLRPNSVAVQGFTSVMASTMGIDDGLSMRRAPNMMYAQAATVMPVRPANTARRSR